MANYATVNVFNLQNKYWIKLPTFSYKPNKHIEWKAGTGYGYRFSWLAHKGSFKNTSLWSDIQ